MNQRLLAEIGRTQRLEIVKCAQTQPRIIGQRIGRSHADELHGHQTALPHPATRRLSRYLASSAKMGRPEMVYRLTRRTHDLFQADSNRFTLELLDSVQGIYGPNAPEKLLYNLFERKCASLKEKVKGATVAERAKSLAENSRYGRLHVAIHDRTMAARRFWNATRRSRTCSINIRLLADSSRKCSNSFSAHECGGRKRAIPDCTSARFTLTRKSHPSQGRVVRGCAQIPSRCHPERSEGSRLHATGYTYFIA